MISNSITLAVDALNNGTSANIEIVRIGEGANSSRYKFPDNSLIQRDYVDFYRTFNKKSGNYNGSAKCAMKITRDVTVPGVDATTSIVAPQICQVSFANPVGTSDANQVELAMRLVGLIIHSEILPKLRQMEV